MIYSIWKVITMFQRKQHFNLVLYNEYRVITWTKDVNMHACVLSFY